MKRNLFLISLLFCICSGKSQIADTGSFILNGKIKGKDSGYVYLFYRGVNETVLDSCQVLQGKFQFKGFVSGPTVANLTGYPLGNRYAYNKTEMLECFIEPGKLSIVDSQGDFRYMGISGSASDKDRIVLIESKRQILDRIDSVTVPFELCYQAWLKERAKGMNSVLIKSLNKKLDLLDSLDRIQLKSAYDSLDQIDSSFIVNNPGSYVAAYMLWRRVGEGPTDQFPDIKKLYDRFPSYIKESTFGKNIRVITEFERNIYPGAEAVNFVALTKQGDTVKLVDFENKKYVLLDFWASWCSPCRHITPILRKIHSKFKDKIELISIANHDKEADWVAAINMDQMTWTQILDNDSSKIIVPGSGSITDAYYINGIPCLILIDKNHKICKLFGFGGKTGSPIGSIDSELEKILQ